MIGTTTVKRRVYENEGGDRKDGKLKQLREKYNVVRVNTTVH